MGGTEVPLVHTGAVWSLVAQGGRAPAASALPGSCWKNGITPGCTPHAGNHSLHLSKSSRSGVLPVDVMSQQFIHS